MPLRGQFRLMHHSVCVTAPLLLVPRATVPSKVIRALHEVEEQLPGGSWQALPQVNPGRPPLLLLPEGLLVEQVATYDMRAGLSAEALRLLPASLMFGSSHDVAYRLRALGEGPFRLLGVEMSRAQLLELHQSVSADWLGQLGQADTATGLVPFFETGGAAGEWHEVLGEVEPLDSLHADGLDVTLYAARYTPLLSGYPTQLVGYKLAQGPEMLVEANDSPESQLRTHFLFARRGQPYTAEEFTPATS